MFKRALVAGALVCALTALPSCMAGPTRLSRSWDDWVNARYTENAWLHGAVFQNVLPVYPIVGAGLGLIDIVILNPFYFWSEDAWDNRGTGFEHENPPETADGRTLTGAF